MHVYAISVTLPSTYQSLLTFVEIWRSSDRNKNAVFWDMVYKCSKHNYLITAVHQSS